MKQKIVKALRRFFLSRNKALVTTMVSLGRERRFDVHQYHYTNEYIRLSHLELAAQEIYEHALPGAVAELGVYRGDFAAILNSAFPDRPLYLFDTFEGFDPVEEARDRANMGLTYRRDFTDTSMDLVLSRLPHPERSIVRKGFFPDTADGLESERFCLVSIDTDLYDPILAGLDFFYPRLVPGGFIFVHDFNNAIFPGAHKAVLDYAARHEVAFFPMSDPWGTAVFRRPFKLASEGK